MARCGTQENETLSDANDEIHLEYTKHASDAMAERRILAKWIALTVNEPARRTIDPNDPEIERFFRAIPEHGCRVLRVVVNTRTETWRVVSVFFDRGMKGEL